MLETLIDIIPSIRQSAAKSYFTKGSTTISEESGAEAEAARSEDLPQ
nr:MAG TPA: hypothetical protein [Caudoviricetes sp.]